MTTEVLLRKILNLKVLPRPDAVARAAYSVAHVCSLLTPSVCLLMCVNVASLHRLG